MCKLTKKFAHPGGSWNFGIQRGGFNKREGEIPGDETPVGAMLWDI